MSITHEVVIWCDVCGTWERSIETAAKARKKLKALGWTHTRGSRGYVFKDWCLTCSKAKEEALADYKSGKLNAEDMQIRYEQRKMETK